MTITLRNYQHSIMDDIRNAWASGAKNVGLVLPTGAGKTVIFSALIAAEQGFCAAIVHRHELLSQMSLALAANGIVHDIIASKKSIQSIMAVQRMTFGRTFFSPNARVFIASVDTLLRRPSDPRYGRVTLLVQDEAHHVLEDNKWGKAAQLFVNARGLYPTATPVRSDGRSLARAHGGVLDALVVGVSMRELIKQGYLSDYRIFAPPSDLDLSHVKTAASGDYSPVQLRDAVKASTITGDVVNHYIRLAMGVRGITFASGIESATEILQGYRQAGVTAELITGKTDATVRANVMRAFRLGEILQLVNVDILGEGVDVPEVGVVSFARPTQSLGLYTQQFGRALRPAPRKTHAIIIDHAGNVMRHGLPDAHRQWGLDAPPRKRRDAINTVLIRVCANPACNAVYPRAKTLCPYCGQKVIYSERTAPEQVDGDLTELDDAALEVLRGEIARIDAPARPPAHLSDLARMGLIKRHGLRQDAQNTLRQKIAQWAGCRRAEGYTDSEIYRLFFATYGVDVMSAQCLSARQALELCDQINFY